jgi:Rieske 2Fe-2S family protein
LSDEDLIMSATSTSATGGYAGLKQVEPGLPSHFYYDPEHYQRELRAVWYRNWMFVCRTDQVMQPQSFRAVTIGDQNILVVRDEQGALHAFHNTCRHRGSVLCAEHEGKLRSKFIVCPYHGWGYRLDGTLVTVPGLGIADDFDMRDYPLYRVAVAEWGGCVFVRLEGSGGPVEEAIRPSATRLANWPMAELATGYTVRTTLACNWKVFWENYSECYHCPGIHPELCNLVPIYGRSIMGQYDDPDWVSHRDDPNPKYRGGLRQDALTWSVDGRPNGTVFPTLTEEERSAGHRFVTMWPTMYMVGHIDHMRMVSMRPIGAEQTELTVTWLFMPETLADRNFDLEKAASFARLVVEQDGAACELNQRGLRSRVHRHGVLMPQEHAVFAFHEWIRRNIATA